MSTTKTTSTQTQMRTISDIYSYHKQALDLLSPDHPHYDEIKKLLTQQIDDEIDTHAHTISD